MNKELKEKIAVNAANEWCRCFKCDGRVNSTGCACEKDNLLTCRNWYNGYRTALLALEDDRVLDSLWKPADGDDLPEIDREVIVLIQDYPDDKDHLRVAFAHRPNKYAKVWNSNLGEEQVVEIEWYDKGGWNIPNVKWWLDCLMPKEIEEL